ncbi:MAG: winged helix-turn-helix domain-containing protein [Spirochaetales bacterium]|nr:winged helix-turn-helix domain-containing protein [Spirochaetales bacterium]
MVYGKSDSLTKAFLVGCSDYLKEPWGILELDFRLKKIFTVPKKKYVLHEQELMVSDSLCSTGHNRVKLSFQESILLKLLLKQKGTLVPRDALYYALWGKLPVTKSRVVDVHVSVLRKKLSLLFPHLKRERFIHSAKGKGYILL